MPLLHFLLWVIDLTSIRCSWAAEMNPAILGVMTLGVLSWEVIGPLLYVLPWRSRTQFISRFVFVCAFMQPLLEYCRLLGIVGQFALHFGFALCLKLETFVWVHLYLHRCK